MQEDELIREFYEDENAWLQDFLLAVSEGNGDQSPSANPLSAGVHTGHVLKESMDYLNSLDGPIPSVELKKIISALKGLSHSSERQGILETLLAKEMEEGDQVLVLESILNDISFSSAKSDLLLRFIAHQKLSGEAKEYLLNDLNKLSFSSEREKVLKALVLD